MNLLVVHDLGHAHSLALVRMSNVQKICAGEELRNMAIYLYTYNRLVACFNRRVVTLVACMAYFGIRG